MQWVKHLLCTYIESSNIFNNGGKNFIFFLIFNFFLHSQRFLPETQIKRQVTQHDCPPSLLGDGHKCTEILYCDEKHIVYWADYIKQGRTKIFCTGTRSPWRTNQGRTPFICTPWVPTHLSFNRGHPFLVSLVSTQSTKRFAEYLCAYTEMLYS